MRKFIDFPSKPRTLKAMREYLAGHYCYAETFRPSGIANLVKFHNLHLTGAERDACYNLYAESDAYDCAGVAAILEAFDKANKPYAIYQAGRSAGYFVLYYTGKYENGPVRADDLDNMESGDVRSLAAVVYEFDKTCNDACAAFVDYAVSTQGEAEPN